MLLSSTLSLIMYLILLIVASSVKGLYFAV